MLYLLKNVSPDKSIELLERQINEINNIEFDNNRSEKIHVFKSKTKQILRKIFSDPDEYTSALDDVQFTSGLYFLDGEDENLERYSFRDGVQHSISLLKGALSNVQLEKEFLEEDSNKNLSSSKEATLKDKTKVFIVHGHDDGLKHEVALFLKHLGIEPIILHEQLDRGQTIFQKFNSHANVGFAIVLYTPCDIGRPAKLNEKGEQYQEKYRARQNVIFEHGFFAAKLGLENAIALKKGDVEIPNDLAGVIYKEYDMAGSWKYQIARELDESGYEINYKLIK